MINSCFNYLVLFVTMKDMLMLQKYSFLQYVPLSLFVWLIRFKYDWPAVFITSGICALLFLMILLKQKNILDRFVLAIYCFLIGGAFMFACNIVWLQNIYLYFDKAMLMLCLFCVGIFSMIMTPSGFIGVLSANNAKRNRCSYYLLGAVAVGLIIALYNRTSLMLAGFLPFVAVRILQIILQRSLNRHK